MKRKLPSITNNIWSCSAIAIVILIWQAVCSFGIVDEFLLPSPIRVVKAFVAEFPNLMTHSAVTLAEAFLGLALGVVLGFLMAVLMAVYYFQY